MLYRVHLAGEGFDFTMSVVLGTDRKDSYKSNYHTITIKTAPVRDTMYTTHYIFIYMDI